MKYSEEELAELAKGVFRDDKTSPSIYADEEGTFKNSQQYDAMSDEEKEKFPFEFKNPNVKETTLTTDPALAKENADLKAEIERLNGLKSVAAVKAAEAEVTTLQSKVAELEAKIVELTPPSQP